MISVLIAGGSGTRLWPLSTPAYPKHLLKINGESGSLLQNTYKRARLLSEKIYIVTDASHIDHVKKQLPELSEQSFIIEPARRGTANCFVAALSVIAEHEDHDEPIAFMHADHYIRDNEGFVHSFHVAGEVSDEQHKLTLIGVEPTYPSTGFGYIQKADILKDGDYVYKVANFKEKPDFKTARQYLNSGNYLWNCGYFVGSLNVFIDEMKRFAPNLLANYEAYLKATPKDKSDVYLGFDLDAIDYALIEHTKDLLVVPASFDWMDIGSFADLHKAVQSDEKGNHIHGEAIYIDEVENCLMQNYEDKPIAVIGLDNIVVINTKEGLLVARKDLSQKVGDIAKSLQVDKPK